MLVLLEQLQFEQILNPYPFPSRLNRLNALEEIFVSDVNDWNGNVSIRNIEEVDFPIVKKFNTLKIRCRH